MMAPRQIVARVRVGPRPVHGYGVSVANEYWVHSDAEGTFYVINLSDVSKTDAADVPVRLYLTAVHSVPPFSGTVAVKRGYSVHSHPSSGLLFFMFFVTAHRTSTLILMQALQSVAAHGKLLWDPTIYPRAYATNTGEHWF